MYYSNMSEVSKNIMEFYFNFVFYFYQVEKYITAELQKVNWNLWFPILITCSNVSRVMQGAQQLFIVVFKQSG